MVCILCVCSIWKKLNVPTHTKSLIILDNTATTPRPPFTSYLPCLEKLKLVRLCVLSEIKNYARKYDEEKAWSWYYPHIERPKPSFDRYLADVIIKSKVLSRVYRGLYYKDDLINNLRKIMSTSAHDIILYPNRTTPKFYKIKRTVKHHSIKTNLPEMMTNY